MANSSMPKFDNNENDAVNSKAESPTELFDRLISGIRSYLQEFTADDTVLIGNCSSDAKETDLNEFFHGFATLVKLQKIELPSLLTTVFIAKFDSAESASRSKVLNTLTLHGKKILLHKSDDKQLFDKCNVVELNGLQEHSEEIIYDHMIAFGNISFILKTSTVTYIVFEELSAVESSCRCDYLDQYPVTIRPVLDLSSASSASIEVCILEQIEQNSNLLVEEEGHIKNFIQLLDMENLDEYLDQDDKEKNTVTNKPLLEIGNEEIIATENEEDIERMDEADVAAIEKQALTNVQNKDQHIVVDRISARKLNLHKNTLLLTDLPQLNVVVTKIEPTQCAQSYVELSADAKAERKMKKHKSKKRIVYNTKDPQKISPNDNAKQTFDVEKHRMSEKKAHKSKNSHHKTSKKSKIVSKPSKEHKTKPGASNSLKVEDSESIIKQKGAEKRVSSTQEMEKSQKKIKLDESASTKTTMDISVTTEEVDKSIKTHEPSELNETNSVVSATISKKENENPSATDNSDTANTAQTQKLFNKPDNFVNIQNKIAVVALVKLNYKLLKKMFVVDKNSLEKLRGTKKKRCSPSSNEIKSAHSVSKKQNIHEQIVSPTETSTKSNETCDEIIPIKNERTSYDAQIEEKTDGNVVDIDRAESSLEINHSTLDESAVIPNSSDKQNHDRTEHPPSVCHGMADSRDVSTAVSIENSSSPNAKQQSECVDQISDCVPDVCNTVEIDQNDSVVVSDDEQPLVIDLPHEQSALANKVEDVVSTEKQNNRCSISLDDRSAALLGDKVHNGCYVYLDKLPQVKVKLQRVGNTSRKIVKQKEQCKQKQNDKPTTTKAKQTELPPKKGTDKLPEKPRKTNLEKIDSKFLPAGSKLKTQAKIKSKLDSSAKKHLPVPELPIELKAHLNTSFKIPKKNADVKPQSIDRNPSELDCLHRDPARDEREKHRKRFQRERKHWENRPDHNSRNKKPRLSDSPACREKIQPSQDCLNSPMNDNYDSSSPPATQHESYFQKNKPENNRSADLTVPRDRKNQRPCFTDIWNLPPNKSANWNESTAPNKPAINPWDSSQNTATQINEDKQHNTIASGDNWSPDGGSSTTQNFKPEKDSKVDENRWSSDIQQNRVDENNYSSSKHYERSRTIDDGESWSPGQKRNDCVRVENTAGDVHQPKRIKPSQSENVHDTIASGDMWDSNVPVVRQGTHSRIDDDDNTLLCGGTWDDEIRQSSDNFTTKAEKTHHSSATYGHRSPHQSSPERGLKKYDRFAGNRGSIEHPSRRECSPANERWNQNKSPMGFSRSPSSLTRGSERQSVGWGDNYDHRREQRSPERNTFQRSQNWHASKNPNERPRDDCPGLQDEFPIRSCSPPPSFDPWNRCNSIENDNFLPRSSNLNEARSNYINRNDRRSPASSRDGWMFREKNEREDRYWSSNRSPNLRPSMPNNQINETASHGETDDNAYSPSGALDSISSSDEDCDFTNPAGKMRHDTSIQRNVNYNDAENDELENRNHSMNPNERNLDEMPSNKIEWRHSNQLHGNTRDIEIASRAEAEEKLRVLEHLKQRAETLKKLEDMKLARQKLLAQIKLKSGNFERDDDFVATGNTNKTKLPSNIWDVDQFSQQNVSQPLLVAPALLQTANSLLNTFGSMPNQPFHPSTNPLPSTSTPPRSLFAEEMKPPTPDNSTQRFDNYDRPGSSMSNQPTCYSPSPGNTVDLSQPPPHLNNPLFNPPPQSNNEMSGDFSRRNYTNNSQQNRFSHKQNAFDQQQNNRHSSFNTPVRNNFMQEEPIRLLPPEEAFLMKSGVSRNFQRNRDQRPRFNNNNNNNNNNNKRQNRQLQRRMQNDAHQTYDNNIPDQQRPNRMNNFNNIGGFQRFNNNNQQQQHNYYQQQNQRNRFNQRNHHQQQQQQMFQPNNNIFDDFDESGCFDMNTIDNNEDDAADWADLME